MSSGYDRDLLFKEVTGIEVDWMQGYGNSPRIQLQGPVEDYKVRSAWFQAGIWKQYPVEGSNLWVLTHPNGFVRYLSHSGKDTNEGGFGGSSFTIYLEGGIRKELRGPWSSRATCVNMVVPEGDHIMDTDHGALRIDAFVRLCEEFNFPYYVVRGKSKGSEPESVAVSTRSDGIYKPNGAGDWKNDSMDFEVLYSPKEV